MSTVQKPTQKEINMKVAKRVVRRTPSEVYRLWIKELRSGNYLQGEGSLKQTRYTEKDRFCCLGVLCDLAVKDGGDDWGTKNGPKAENYFLPEKIRFFMGLTKHEMKKLADDNDNGASFKELADHIEKKIMPKKIARTV